MTHEWKIDVQEIEALQTINDREALEQIFEKARRMVVGGGIVILVRMGADGAVVPFDEISTEADLATYQQHVFKYVA